MPGEKNINDVLLKDKSVPAAALAALVERADDFVLFLTPDGGVRFANRQARRWLGLANASDAVAALRYSDLSAVLWKSDLQVRQATEAWHSALLNGESTWEACVVDRGQGTNLEVSCRLQSVENGIALTLRDITPLNSALRGAREVEEEFKRFAYIVSHDLKEPLRMISSYIQLVKRKLPATSPDIDDFMGFAIDGAKRLGGLLDGLVQYSRIDTPSDEVDWVESQVSLERALGALEVPIREAEARIETGPLPRLRTSGKQLGSVFQHLLSNSLQFHRGGAPQIEVGAREAGSDWLFWVKDAGIGISPADLERAFIVFQRLPEGGSKGLGMGLALAKKIICRLGGRIWIEPNRESGITVFFTLPAPA